jgi:hypothetical protein
MAVNEMAVVTGNVCIFMTVVKISNLIISVQFILTKDLDEEWSLSLFFVYRNIYS